jgi:hypothetical protein
VRGHDLAGDGDATDSVGAGGVLLAGDLLLVSSAEPAEDSSERLLSSS